MKRFIVLGFFLIATFLYASFLSRTPIHLNQDELGFSLNAFSVAKTGFDENGRFLPLYFWHLGVMWATPVIAYLTSLFLTALPLSETVIRLPSVAVGIANLVLIFFLAERVFKSKWYGLLSAGFLALTPVHFIHSRILLDNLFIVPFVTAWLLALYLFLEKKKPWLLFAAAFVLGVGVYSYHAAKIMLPLYLLFTLVFIWPQAKKDKRLLLFPLLGFFLPLLPHIPWLAQYPDTLVDQVRYTRLYDPRLGAASGIATLLTPESLTHRLGVFLAYFDPYFLFARGDASLIHSTGRSGVFSLSFLVLLPLGIYQAIKKQTRVNLLLVLGFFTAPLAATLVGDHYRISRALTILPFATLLAAWGVYFLIFQKKRLVRVFCYLLLVGILFQFSFFLADYFTDYRVRSYSWFRYNIPGALESAIEQDSKSPLGAIYLDERIGFIDRYWRFYVVKNKKEDLLAKSHFFDPYFVELDELPANSLLVYHFDHVDGQKEQIGPFRKVATVFEPDGTSRFFLFRN